MAKRFWVLLLVLTAACDDGAGTESLADMRITADVDRPNLGDAVRDDAAPPADAAPLSDTGPTTDLGAADAAGADAAPSPTDGVLQIDPERAELQLQPGGPPPSQAFVVSRHGLPGGPVELPAARVTFAVTPPNLGAVDAAGVFTSSGQEGRATVRATHDDDTVEALVDITALGDVLEPGAPPDARARFEAAPEGEGCAPTWDYPEPLTVIPRNMAGLSFQWGARGHDLFRVTLTAGNLNLSWFTTATKLVPGGPEWEAALRNAVGGSLRVTLTGLGGQGDAACSAVPMDLLVDPSQMLGAIYYWSTGDSGIMRIAIGETAPEPFLGPAVSPEINCPACHALSRDGQKIAITRTTFPPFGELFISAVTEPRRSFFNPAGISSYFPSFAPDSNTIVGGTSGQLVIRDVTSGAETERLPMPMTHYGASPDWHWTEDRIVATYASRALNPLPDVGLSQGAIAQWVKQDGAWSQPDVLVDYDEEQGEADRPAYSPEGTYVAFNRSGGNANRGQAMGNPGNALWIIPAGGGVPPVELARANQAPGLGNAWPKWSPTDRRGRLWMAFSSTRDYGHELVQAGDSPRPQLWVTAIDPDAPPGTDPSAPAFWLPYQSLQSGNHIPYWSVYEKD